jgi:hypothetical protein
MWQIVHRTDVGRGPTTLFSVRIHGHPGADEPGGGAGVIGAGETKTGQQSRNGAGSGLDEAQRKAKAKQGSLALYTQRRQKFQKWIIHRKIKFTTSTILHQRP